jgi:hypothetical protein
MSAEAGFDARKGRRRHRLLTIGVVIHWNEFNLSV